MHVIYKLVVGCLIVMLLLTAQPIPARAAEDFQTDYVITYDVSPSGSTHVTQAIILTNLQSGTYAKEYTLTVSSVAPKNVAAFNASGTLPVEVTRDGQKTLIKVPFKERVIGKDKSSSWTITYDANEVVTTKGAVKSITIPRIGLAGGLGEVRLTVKIPKSFGMPSSVSPTPIEKSENFASQIFTFAKENLLRQGVYAIFGSSQYYAFTSRYQLVNTSLVTIEREVVLPPTTAYQAVSIDEITPRPQSMTNDPNGNWIAKFSVKRGEKVAVTIAGRVKLTLTPQFTQTADAATKRIMTQATKFWESDDPKIISTSKELTKNVPATDKVGGVQEKARQIFNFVTTTLTFRSEDATEQQPRTGATQALTQTKSATDFDFADATVALLRAAGIPAKVVIGWADANNLQLRQTPQGTGQYLHAWVAYYQPTKGWVPIDPTWTATTGGIDYFDHWDINHVALSMWGVKPDRPVPAGLKVNQLSDPLQDFTIKVIEPYEDPKQDLYVTLQVTSKGFASVPTRAEVVLENRGVTAITPTQFSLQSQSFQFLGNTEFTVDVLPPKSQFRYPFTFRSPHFFQLTAGTIDVKINGQAYTLPVSVSPFAGSTQQMLLVPFIGGLVIGLLVYLGFMNQRPIKRAVNQAKRAKKHKA